MIQANSFTRCLRKFVCSVLPAFILFYLVSCSGKAGKFGSAVIPEYPVLRLSVRSMTVHDEYPATIQGTQDIGIRPKIEGYIQEIHVQEGAEVKKGQLLFHIRNQEYEDNVQTALARIQSAQAEVNEARLGVEKARPLVESDIVSKFELESAEYTLETKIAALEEAKASLATAKTNLDYTYIHSPHDGVIGTIPYKIGALVNSSMTEPLTTLSENSSVNAYFVLNEKELISLFQAFPGKTLQEKFIRLPEAELILADGSKYKETGKVEPASGIIETGTGSVSIKAVFPNREGLLRSGASATVSLPHRYDSVLVIPQSATYEVLNKYLLYKLDENDQVFSTAISVVPTDDGRFFIVTGGLTENDRIVLEGHTTLQDSMKIHPVIRELPGLTAGTSL
ncbi:MAG: efflux RND transporter periplasmic adaptor subunit [Mangrovibacterium sp.]